MQTAKKKKNNYNANESISDFFEKRLIFVTGKGGCGKTVISAALAMAAREMGKKVLIAEVGQADALGFCFNLSSLPEIPSPADPENQPGIWGVRVNPRATLEEYIRSHVGIDFVANRITRAKLFDHLTEATPGLKEIMTLGQIWRWSMETNNETNEYLYDMIIVDAPASGHGLNLIRQPRALMQMIRFGPIARQIEQVLNLMNDTKKTGIISVAIPESLSVNETLEFEEKIRSDMDYCLDYIIINGLYPKRFSDEDENRIFSIIESKTIEPGIDESMRHAFQVAKWQIAHRKRQMEQMKRVTDAEKCPVIRIPFYFSDIFKSGPKMITKIASVLISQMKVESL